MDKYVKIRKIGEGAFGKAELVKRKKDASQFVVKEINIMRMGSKEREEARKEVSVLAQLNHPSIVAYRESFEENGSLHIVMDYCAGGDLYAKINNQRGILFTEDMILDWFVQMCLAIKHIHDRKILHRDIKSQNIFLTANGRVQLGDFGIAKVLNSTAELARTCIGTPYYLSPEICENKPYNNKSDIWSLGCVLYEIATLKHAFEAGNMKNLVLKIIRGSYPPVSPKYSYEMRNLISALFKRAPRDRPSINSVLKKPLISQRITKFLSDEQVASEFSHTIMHGQKLARALPPPPKVAARPPSASRNRGDVGGGGGAVAASAAKKYDPSRIYGAPVVRKSKENRAPVAKRPGSSGGSRPGSAAGSRPGSAAGSRPGSAAGSRPSSAQDLQKKKQDLQERERKRRDEEKRKEYAQRHKDLQEKQKMARINRSREDGWQGVLSSLDSDSGKEIKPNREPAKDPPRQQPAAPRPVVNAGGDYNGNAAGRGKYDHYNNYLDKLQKDRNVRQRQDNVPQQAPAGAYMGAPRPLPGAPQPAPVWRQAPKPTPYQQYNQRGQDQQQERAKLVDDFINRKREAAVNKHRGQEELFGPNDDRQRPPSANQRRPEPQPQQRPGSAQSSRNREEQEYLEKLRQIRQQNYHERKNLQAKVEADKNPEKAAEERKKKAEALKKQAEDWAKQRREVLEQKRHELIEKERQMRGMRPSSANRGGPPPVKPRPAAVPMTGAMNAIGATPRVVPQVSPAKPPAMTGVLGAIGATPNIIGTSEDTRPKTPLQKQKDEILKKVNQKGPPNNTDEPQDSARSKWGGGGGDFKFAEATQQEEQRSKWGQGEGLKLAENVEEESSRPQWGGGAVLDLGKLTLEQTASQMEVTSARDRVIVNPDSARRQWGKPGDTVMNALQGVPLSGTMASNQSEDSIPSPVSTNENPTSSPAVGSTITIPNKKAPITKGTITIRTADENKANATNQNLPSPTSTNEKAAKSPRSSPIKETTEPPLTQDDTEKELSTNQNSEKNETNNENTKSVEKSEPSQSEPAPDVKAESEPSISQSKASNLEKPPLPARKPPMADKPAVSEKPLMFPKPVLLAKPDAPRQFAPSQPSSTVKTEGAGSLFEKVQLDEEEVEQKQEPAVNKEDKLVIKELPEKFERQKTGLMLGITMGSFDIGHQELLRTCSEPDLTKLFKTMGTANIKVRSLDDISSVNEEDEDSLADVYSNMEKATESATADEEDDDDVNDDQDNDDNDDNTEHADGDDENEDEDDEDIADLMSVRETMQSLLIDSDDDSSKRSPVKFSMSSDRESRGDTNDGDIEDTEDDDIDTADGGDNEQEDEERQEEPGEEDEVDPELIPEGEEDDNDGALQRSHSVDNENPQTPDERAETMSDLFQTDDEDEDSEFNDGEDGDYDLFGRLEESRAKLEEELGAEKLIQVYKTVQALQEDEDENMEEGARIATDMLGKDKEHLYPKIFQLVMADTAFTDDSAYDLSELAASFR